MSVTEDRIDHPSCCDGEMTADIETATAMANSGGSAADTAHIYAYEGGGTKLSDLLDAWEAAHSDNKARVASTSFGAPEFLGPIVNGSIGDFDAVINAMTAEGWTIDAASGDHGPYDNRAEKSVDFPASNPNVVAVGGTSLSLTNVGGFGGETAWDGIGCGATGGNGGGGAAAARRSTPVASGSSSLRVCRAGTGARCPISH